jgi:hypothetical protein
MGRTYPGPGRQHRLLLCVLSYVAGLHAAWRGTEGLPTATVSLSRATGGRRA